MARFCPKSQVNISKIIKNVSMLLKHLKNSSYPNQILYYCTILHVTLFVIIYSTIQIEKHIHKRKRVDRN